MMNIFLSAALLTLLYNCKKEEKYQGDIIDIPTKVSDNIKVVKNLEKTSSTEFQTFGFPAEVEGCSCYFSKNKDDFDEGKYVYIDDYGNNAYIKLDHELIKTPMVESDFDPINFKKSITTDDITITLEGKKIEELEEVMMFQGNLSVKKKNGETNSTPIYGECGC
ncbi:hypothetical protein [Chryseobacterium sp. MP_3.2]|uniref:hypothetical protein n=1 Tax=Chryseobacterium sp. MP_3.2 TaxID=3071712 RepID=UPI002E01763A|nr:hypothetical protein [Chryseobacterium sp. MP_3.2]